MHLYTIFSNTVFILFLTLSPLHTLVECSDKKDFRCERVKKNSSFKRLSGQYTKTEMQSEKKQVVTVCTNPLYKKKESELSTFYQIPSESCLENTPSFVEKEEFDKYKKKNLGDNFWLVKRMTYSNQGTTVICAWEKIAIPLPSDQGAFDS